MYESTRKSYFVALIPAFMSVLGQSDYALIANMGQETPVHVCSSIRDSIADTLRSFLRNGAYGKWRPNNVLRTQLKSPYLS